jgi:hypothetical protein
MTLLHQKHRRRDEQGRFISDYSDYAIVYQLLEESFAESLGDVKRYTDDRIRLIENVGMMTPRALSEKIGISTAAISQWLKPLIEKRVLRWCDERGLGFKDVAELERAKRSGKAYLTVSERCCLPTVCQLTGDSRWDLGGEYWQLYDLGIESSDPDEVESTVLPEIETENFIDEKSVPLDADGAVKVLSEKTGPDNNFQNDSLDSGLVPETIDNLADEFSGLLQMN